MEQHQVGHDGLEDLVHHLHLLGQHVSIHDEQYHFLLLTRSHSIPLYGFTYTVPTIINELGYTAAEAQLLTIPIYTAGAISTMALSRLSDRLKTRWPFIVFPYALALCGFIGLMAVPHPALPGLTYGLLFAVPSGVYPGVLSVIAWISNNTAPTWKRAIGMAMMITLGNIGGIVGSNIYYSHEAPHYWSGYGTSLSFLCAAIIATLVLRWSYARSNKERDAMTEQEIRQKYTERESPPEQASKGFLTLQWTRHTSFTRQLMY